MASNPIYKSDLFIVYYLDDLSADQLKAQGYKRLSPQDLFAGIYINYSEFLNK